MRRHTPICPVLLSWCLLLLSSAGISIQFVIIAGRYSRYVCITQRKPGLKKKKKKEKHVREVLLATNPGDLLLLQSSKPGDAICSAV